MMLGNTVDRLGLDTNEAGWVLGCAMECFERGILHQRGHRWARSDLGQRRGGERAALPDREAEGLGDTLAEGVAARRPDRSAAAPSRSGVYTMKGATPRGHDHRARWTEMFDTSVSESGALDNTLLVADLTQFGLPAKIDPFDPDALAQGRGEDEGGDAVRGLDGHLPLQHAGPT